MGVTLLGKALPSGKNKKEKNLSLLVENAILSSKYKKVLKIINEMCDILKWNDEKAHRKV